MRVKENHYRFLAEPDLPIYKISDEMIEYIGSTIALCRSFPDLPGEMQAILAKDRKLADFVAASISKARSRISAARWILEELKSSCNVRNITIPSADALSVGQVKNILEAIEKGHMTGKK